MTFRVVRTLSQLSGRLHLNKIRDFIETLLQVVAPTCKILKPASRRSKSAFLHTAASVTDDLCGVADLSLTVTNNAMSCHRATALLVLLSVLQDATSFRESMALRFSGRAPRLIQICMQNRPEWTTETIGRQTAPRKPRLRETASAQTRVQAFATDGEEMDLSGLAVCSNEVDVGDNSEVSIAQARLLILLAALLCGTNFGSIKFVQDGGLLPPIFLSSRFALAAAAMSPLLAKLNPKCFMLSAEAGMWLGLGYVFQAAALQTTPAGTTAFLCSLTTVVCPIIEKLTGVRVTVQAWGAALMAVAGAAVLELSGDEVPGLGDLLALMQPVMFGVNFFRTEQLMREFPDQALPSTAIQVAVCALLGVAWALADAHGLPDISVLLQQLHEPAFDLALLWVSLASTALILVLQAVSLAKLPSSEAAVVFSSEPLWAAGFAGFLLHERIGLNTVGGGSLIIAACIVRVLDIDRARRHARVARRRAAKALSTFTLQR